MAHNAALSNGERDTVVDMQKQRLSEISKSQNGLLISQDLGQLACPSDQDPMMVPQMVAQMVPQMVPPSPSTSNTSVNEVESYFNPLNLRRAESVYSLSRASFSNQLSQLASLQLPQASSLASSISAIPTASAASRALTDAAEQIRRWMQKASQVLEDLDAEDDVEWAAAGGREGLGEVDKAVIRFESLIAVYVGAIEELQSRQDVAVVPSDELTSVVAQMEKTLGEWEQVRSSLENVKKQVELAMEWEELLNVVLGDIGMEIEDLARLVFEMEEKRHRTLLGQDTGNNLDIGELETIVEETPSSASRGHGKGKGKNGVSLGMALSPTSPLQSPDPVVAQDDSTLLALFARMQPLRASLDFLPMRLSSFHTRAQHIFRSACEELQSRRESLESEWKELERDAEGLRRELGEDRWVLVFRNAGRQAQKMCESVGRSVLKVREAIDAGAQLTNPSSLAKRVESYEAKKMHYGPAIERVLAIIERGISDRLTVNGEILRLRSDTDAQWKSLEQEMKGMDMTLEALSLNKNQQLRDSISTIMSLDRSATESATNTPGSSPASSVVMSGSNDPSTPSLIGKIRPRSSRASSIPRPSTDKRHVSMPAGSLTKSQLGRKPSASRDPSTPVNTSRLASPSRSTSRASVTPTPGNWKSRPSVGATDGKPRWNSSVNTRDSVIGHNFKPLSLMTPSPHQLGSPSRASMSSIERVQYPSPLSREHSKSPSANSPSHQALAFRDRNSSISPARSAVSNVSVDRAQPRLKNHASSSHLPDSRMGRRRTGMLGTSTTIPGIAEPEKSTTTPVRPKVTRPASAMASGRRSSLLPQPKSTLRSFSGRDSMAGRERAGSSLGTPSNRTSASGRASPAVGRASEQTRPPWR